MSGEIPSYLCSGVQDIPVCVRCYLPECRHESANCPINRPISGLTLEVYEHIRDYGPISSEAIAYDLGISKHEAESEVSALAGIRLIAGFNSERDAAYAV